MIKEYPCKTVRLVKNFAQTRLGSESKATRKIGIWRTDKPAIFIVCHVMLLSNEVHTSLWQCSVPNADATCRKVRALSCTVFYD